MGAVGIGGIVVCRGISTLRGRTGSERLVVVGVGNHSIQVLLFFVLPNARTAFDEGAGHPRFSSTEPGGASV